MPLLIRDGDAKSVRYQVANQHHRHCATAIAVGANRNGSVNPDVTIKLYDIPTPFDEYYQLNNDCDTAVVPILRAISECELVVLPIGLNIGVIEASQIDACIQQRQVVVFFSAGNNGGDVRIPEGLRSIVTVGATMSCDFAKRRDGSDGEWWWASSGREDVDVLMYCQIPVDRQKVESAGGSNNLPPRYVSGTSVAASIATGVFAKQRCLSPRIRVEDVRWFEFCNNIRCFVNSDCDIDTFEQYATFAVNVCREDASFLGR